MPEKTMAEKIQNTFDEWVSCKNRLEKAVETKQLNKGDTVKIYLELTDHVENLIYFYPISDMLHDIGIRSSLEIRTDKAESPEDMQIRVEHFLFVLQLLKTGAKPSVTVNSEDLFRQTRFGKLQPLLTVSKNRTDKFFYQRLFQSELDFELVEKVLEYYIDETFSGKDFSLDKRLELQDFIKLNSHFYSMRFIQNNKSYFSRESAKSSQWSNLFDIKYNDSVNIVFAKLTLSNIFYSIETLTGIKDVVNLKKEEKGVFSAEMLSGIKEVICDMPVLSQYIWSLLLRFQLESKNLVVQEEEEHTYYKSLFDTTLTQAQALADGLYQLIENSCLHSKSGTGYFYLRVHETRISNAITGSRRFDTMEDHIQVLKNLNEEYFPLEVSGKTRFYVEVRFVDNAFGVNGTNGMIDHFNRTNTPVDNLKSLFWRVPESIEDLTVHYGLRVFERAVRMNQGALMVYTPSQSNAEGGCAYRSVYGKGNENFTNEKPYYHGTIYRVLLPIADAITYERLVSTSEAEPLFELTGWERGYLPYLIQLTGKPEYNNFEGKSENVKQIFNQITAEIRSIPDKENRIICIDPKGFLMNHMELLAKALIKYLLNNRKERNLIAVFLTNRYQIIEFTRTYTAFFDRSGLNYQQHELEDTQIALCLCKDNEACVSFVLSGNDLMTARKTVINYLYYNSQHCVEFFPLVTYLTGFMENRKSNERAKSVIPFDLYLDVAMDQPYRNDKIALDSDNIWFIKYIHKILDTDMQANGYGCKLKDVHVSLGSKIHTDTFYNAELLFHNYANVFRFAYLVARDIMKEHKSAESLLKASERRNNIVMVAYGEYSLLLIQKVCDMIRDSDIGYTANYILFPSYLTPEEQRDWQTHGKEFMDFVESVDLNDAKGLSGYKFYILVPVSTTLATVRKIQDALLKRAKNENIKGKLEYGISTSLIIAGGIEDMAGVKMRYWKEIRKDNHIIVLEEDKKVRYYFNKPSKWYNASSGAGCELCDVYSGKNRKSLVGVDKTSTLPDAIFDTLDREKRTFKIDSADANLRRMKKLYGCVKYSHIASEHNHFLYDIDYEAYCRDPGTNAEIRQWLLKKVRPQIDSNCFNIVVSPLHSSNSRFLKNVLECAFDSSSRIININFHSSYRDEIRSKLEFITEEYKRLRINISNIHVHVYYVDDCIIEGTTFQRSKQFIYMLLAQAGLRMDTVSLYHGIILLSNRSSYDTIQNLLCRPLKDSFFYYLRLNVPSFNTKNRICPACALSEQYLLMKKRASTNVVASEYRRLYKKHNAKSRLDYNEWMNRLLQEEAYFSKFKTWLYYAVCYDESSDRYFIVNILGERFPLTQSHDPELWNMFSSSIGSVLNGETALEYKSTDEKTLTAISKVLQKHFLSDKDYCRMICTHEIFTALEGFHNEEVSDSVTAEKYESDLRLRVLSLFRERMTAIDSELKELSSGTRLWLKAEWIISYIKIISRKQPSQYYHLRNVMYNILIDWLDCIVKDKPIEDLAFLTDICRLNASQNMENSIMPDMKFRIFLTIVRRLSAMQSPYLIRNMNEIAGYYDSCSAQYHGKNPYHMFFLETESQAQIYHTLVDFPRKDHFDMNLAKLTKWSSMNGVDDSRCFLAERVLMSYPVLSDAIMLSVLENTQVIYTGIKKMLMDGDVDWKNKEAVKEHVDSILKEEEKFLKSDTAPMNFHHPYLEFTRFSDIADDASKKGDFSEKVTCMLMLFSALCDLEGRSKPVDHPYDYVEVCNSIRDIAGYEQCRIFSFRDHRVSTIISSDVHRKYLMVDIREEVFDEVFTKYCSHQTADYGINRVAQKYTVGETEVMVVSLLAPKAARDVSYSSNYFLVLYRNQADSGEAEKIDLTVDDLTSLRDFLFLRDRLEIVLDRDIASLISMINSYDYVEPIVADRDPVILHISDLHVSESSKPKDMAPHIPFREGTEEIGKIGQPDLLLITGDVINGNYSAAGLQKTYENAEEYIRFIARVLWRRADDPKYIRSDWNKRILISVGNHDYASMNELKATNSKRITTSGKPGELGDVMIKHSYFAQFVHRLLGLDIDEIIKNDLNQVVNYRKLGLSVLNLNSNSNVNPLRTNKVSVNGAEIERMIKNVTLEKNLIYLIHHTPIYTIDYVDDVYYLKDGAAADSINAAVSGMFIDAGLPDPGKPYNRIWIKLLKSLANEFEDDVNGLEKEKQKELLKRILGIMSSAASDKSEDLFEDFRYYLSCSEPEYDDRCRRIVYDLNEQIHASISDQRNYALQAYGHFKKLSDRYPGEKEYMILGGHTHRAAKYTAKLSVPMSGCRGIYEAGMFVQKAKDDSIKLNYYVFSVGAEKKLILRSGEEPEEKRMEGSILEQILSM